MSETEAYILNAVQTPASLRTVYDSIDRGNTTTEALQSDTSLSEDLLGQGLTGLQLIGLIGRREPDYYTVQFPWETGDPDRDFRLAVLHELASDATPGDWGKQSVVLLNYRYLLKNDVQVFENNDSVIYGEMDDLAAELGYRPQSKQGLIKMNDVKFVNWSRLTEYLGLVYKASGRCYTTCPDEDLVYHSIKLAIEETKQDRIGMREYVDWLNENLLLFSLTADRNVPGPLSRVLFNLVSDGQIRIVESGDAGAVGLMNVPARPGIDRDANAIEVRA